MGNEVLVHAMYCVSLENMMLSERTHAQKPTYCMIPWAEWSVGRDRSWFVFASGWRGLTANGYGLLGVMKCSKI